MVISVGWLDPAPKCWDTHLIRLLLDGGLYKHGLQVRHHAGFPAVADGCVLVCPGKYWAGHYDHINAAISKYSWCLFFRCSDEEDDFNLSQVEHANARFWCQYPRTDREYPPTRFFGVGFPEHFDNLPKDPPIKDLDVFLSAQRTHIRRDEAFDALEDIHCFKKHVAPTEGFTQGMTPTAYADSMADARIAPCPSGIQSVDSFRCYEALESHAVPLVDAVSPVQGESNYWEWLYGTVPFPVVTDWSTAPDVIAGLLGDWPASANRAAAWWCRQKRKMAHNLLDDLEDLGAL